MTPDIDPYRRLRFILMLLICATIGLMSAKAVSADDHLAVLYGPYDTWTEGGYLADDADTVMMGKWITFENRVVEYFTDMNDINTEMDLHTRNRHQYLGVSMSTTQAELVYAIQFLPPSCATNVGLGYAAYLEASVVSYSALYYLEVGGLEANPRSSYEPVLPDLQVLLDYQSREFNQFIVLFSTAKAACREIGVS